ncbi:MAG: sigma-70 family RNA polymerase sigma factor [Chloroflexi bacterium]|nr:sigma-70 family RNA polymerase sigma factor [Chloroflexota bacterium]
MHYIATAPGALHLIQRIARQDERALMELYEAYGSLVYSLALRVVQNPGLAEEVTQDIFLKIWQQPTRWNPALGHFNSWLLAITRNAAIDRLRKEQRHTPARSEQLDAISETSGQAPLFDDPHWYDGQLLARLLSQMPAEQRHLIELAFYQGYTHSELAQTLNLPLGTVKTRLRMGLQKLRQLWEENR